MKVYQALARKLDAYHRCRESGNAEWQERHEQAIAELVEGYMPHGSGIDAGLAIDLEKSSDKRLVFYSSFHVMKDGYYTHWIDFRVVVKPSLAHDINLEVYGRFGRDQDLKDIIWQRFHDALTEEVK